MGVTLCNPCCNMQKLLGTRDHAPMVQVVWKYVRVQAMVLNLHPIGVWNYMKVFKMDRSMVGPEMKAKNSGSKKTAGAIWGSRWVNFFAAVFEQRKVQHVWSIFWCHEIWFQNPLGTNFQSSNIISYVLRPPPWGNDYRYSPRGL